MSKEEKADLKEEKEAKTEKTEKAEKTEKQEPKKKEAPKQKKDKPDFEAKCKDLEQQCADLKDQMLRRQAELDNYKKRLIKEKEDAVLFANTKLIEELLVFMDNLERATAAAKQGGDVKALTDGIEMIQQQLMGALDKNWGLEAIKTVGEDFNPMEHEACMAVVDESLETEKVLEEFQKGYKLHERVIRPAKVKIGKPE